MMKNFPDLALYFGEVTAATAGAFPKTVFIGKSQPDRMHVRFFVTTACTGGTSLTFKLQGKTGNGDYADLAVSPAIATNKLTKGAEIVVEIPEGKGCDTLKVTATASGTYTAGKIEAWIDTYLGL